MGGTSAAYPAWTNLAEMMFSRAAQWPDRPMLRHAGAGGVWHSITWGTFARLAAAAARGFLRAGVAPGDRVLIVSENRPEYPIAETALLAIRAIPVPTYVTNTTADHAHVLADCGARVVVVANATLAARVAAAQPLDLLVTLDAAAGPAVAIPGQACLAWAELLGDTDLPATDIAALAAAIPAGALACIIYTSGTGGTPKGVMLPHRAVLANCRGAFELVRPLQLGREVYLSFLPLSHSFEHTAGQFFLLSIGTEVAYARGIEHLAADMQAVRPTIMTMVPRILDVIRARILANWRASRPGGRRCSTAPSRSACGGRRVGGSARPTGCSTGCWSGWCEPRCAPASAAGCAPRCRAAPGWSRRWGGSSAPSAWR